MNGALQVPCPNCQSGLGQRCTAPTNSGRTSVAYFHTERIRDANDSDIA